MTEKYPALGTTIKALRNNSDGETVKITGKLCAIFLNPDKRMMAQVQSTEKDDKGENIIYNVDWCTVNCSDKLARQYKGMIKKIKKLSDNGNRAAQIIVDGVNEEVQAVYTGILGAPLVLSDDQEAPEAREKA